jgi:hypothetical protein
VRGGLAALHRLAALSQRGSLFQFCKVCVILVKRVSVHGARNIQCTYYQEDDMAKKAKKAKKTKAAATKKVAKKTSKKKK